MRRWQAALPRPRWHDAGLGGHDVAARASICLQPAMATLTKGQCGAARGLTHHTLSRCGSPSMAVGQMSKRVGRYSDGEGGEDDGETRASRVRAMDGEGEGEGEGSEQ